MRIAQSISSLLLLAALIPACDAGLVDETEEQAAASRACKVHEEVRSCGEDDAGISYCDYLGEDWEEGAMEWGPCLDLQVAECSLGETRSCGFDPDEGFGDPEAGCVLTAGIPEFDPYACDTPLVLSFDRAPVAFQSSSAAFDIGGSCASTDWPTAATPWLALDIDGNGAIDSQAELFGSGTVLPSGTRAANGFLALAALDVNADGRVDARDPRFAELVVWTDTDGDKVSSLAELTPISDAGLVGIEVHYDMRSECDGAGNCSREHAPFQYRNALGELQTGEVVDVHLACK